MKALPFGTQVRIIKEGTDNEYHGFKMGQVVTAVGRCFDELPMWQDFTNLERTVSQYLMPQHYELVVAEASVDTDELLDKVVDSDLPSKVVYAIVDKDNEIVSCKVDRDKARETKALLGGKRKGVRIFQYVATKEIR